MGTLHNPFGGKSGSGFEPAKAFSAPLGAASPLWLAFMGAASAGVAYWWLTRWARPHNVEAAVAKAPSPAPAPKAEVAEVKTVSEPVVAPEIVAEAAPVSEPINHAVTTPAVAAEPVVEAPASAKSPQKAKAAPKTAIKAEPETVVSPPVDEPPPAPAPPRKPRATAAKRAASPRVSARSKRRQPPGGAKGPSKRR